MMKFRYSTSMDGSTSVAVVSCSSETVQAEGLCFYGTGCWPQDDDWKEALEHLASVLAKQLEESRKDVDQLAEALEQALTKIDKEPTAAKGTIWDQQLVDCMGQKVAAMNEKLLTKDEK